MRQVWLFLIHSLWITLVWFAAPALADAQVNTNGTEHAIGGYDPVAFFTQQRSRHGAEEFAHEWGGATWLFVSAENRDRFRENPERYAPQYGGYCAYAVAQGNRARIDPRAWSIVDDKLYLNYSLEIRDRWRENQSQFIRQADENWPRLRSQ